MEPQSIPPIPSNPPIVSPPPIAPEQPLATSVSSSRDWFGWIVVGATFLTGIIITFLVFTPTRNRLVIADQPLGNQVLIKDLQLTKGGFIVVYAVSDEVQRVALAGYFPPGKYHDFWIALNDPSVPTTKVNLDRLRGTYLVARLLENRNFGQTKTFEGVPAYHDDTTAPFYDLLAHPIVVQFKVQ